MNFWELIGLPTKKSVDSLQSDINELRVQIEALTRVVAKDEQIVQVSARIAEVNKETLVLKEGNNNICMQIQNTETNLNEEIKMCQRELECSYSSINSKMKERNTKDFKNIKNELEDMGILLKALAMQGISEEIDQIVE